MAVIGTTPVVRLTIILNLFYSSPMLYSVTCFSMKLIVNSSFFSSVLEFLLELTSNERACKEIHEILRLVDMQQGWKIYTYLLF